MILKKKSRRKTRTTKTVIVKVLSSAPSTGQSHMITVTDLRKRKLKIFIREIIYHQKVKLIHYTQ